MILFPQQHYCFVSLVLLALVSSGFVVGKASSFTIQQEKWMYKGKYPIAYETVQVDGSGGKSSGSNKEPIVLLNGFGVGSFHQHRLMERLFSEDNFLEDRKVYGMDYLGQGSSWPIDCEDGFSSGEQGLKYSGDMWVDQAIQFIEQIVLQQSHGQQHPVKKVHLVGNSVGGHLAVFLAAIRPDLIESVVLLNATPVWGLNLPGWSGQLPAPLLPRLVGRYLFDRMRDLPTIRRFLANSYAIDDAYGEELVQQIRGATEGTGGHAAFASILWSPPVNINTASATAAGDGDSETDTDNAPSKSFYECLQALTCDVLIVFGKDDPWCKPAFAKKMLSALDERGRNNNAPMKQQPIHRYVELSNVGHCPNHEAPIAVARLLKNWADTTEENNRQSIPLVQGPQEIIMEQWGQIIVEERQKDDIPLGIMDRLATTFVG